MRRLPREIITTLTTPLLTNRLSLTVSVAAIALFMAACATPPAGKRASPAANAPATTTTTTDQVLRQVNYAELPGWAEDDLRQAWPALLSSCAVLIKKPGWQEVCGLTGFIDGSDAKAIRNYFETQFSPYQVKNADGSVSGLLTGYYEPLLRGARARGGAFQTPIYRAPEDLLTIDLAGLYPELKNKRLRGRVVGKKVVPYFSRAELSQFDSLAGNELLWVDNPIEAFFLQIQGSGRVYLEESKETVRLAYSDQNGHPYKSIGRYLADRGELELDQASAQGIMRWAASNPARMPELLNANPSFVFFREEKLNDPSLGPKGALGVPLTAQRSIAIDPQYIPLGAPVFLASTQPNSGTLLRRLMLAQDTGGAIRNPVRADFFWGFGADAAEKAGKMKQSLMLWVLLPNAMAMTTKSASKE